MIDLMTTLRSASLSRHDLLRLENEAGVELVDGKVVEKPVSIESSIIESIVTFLLLKWAFQYKTARVFSSSMGYQCFAEEPSRFRKPDVSVVNAERLVGVDPQSGFTTIPPDLAVEVLSPNDLAYEIDAKVEEYLQNGFGLVWVVHPNTRAVSIYRPDGTLSLLHRDDEISAEPVLPGFRCKVADFFPSRAKAVTPTAAV